MSLGITGDMNRRGEEKTLTARTKREGDNAGAFTAQEVGKEGTVIMHQQVSCEKEIPMTSGSV